MAIDRGWRRWFALAGLALLLIGLWQVPWLGGAVYPFRVFGTFVHELSHGLAAIATGGDFVRFAVSPDLSGVAHSAGGWRVVVASAGYIGSAVFGGVLSFVSYGLVLWAMTQASIAGISALRETSVVFAAVIGMLFLGEKAGAHRIAGALTVACGALLLKLG